MDKGCYNCKHRSLKVNEGACDSCFEYREDNKTYPNWEPEDIEPEETTASKAESPTILSIIADAVKDGKHSVYIQLDHANVVSVNITPMPEEEEMLPSRYCRTCGEALKKE